MSAGTQGGARAAAPLPAGSIDTHFHIFGPAGRYPFAEGRSYTPQDAPMADYLALAQRLGFSRAVIVHPSPYGTDNTRSLDAMAESPIPMRGVAVVEADVTDAELDRMHAAGMRGARLNIVFNKGLALETAHRLAPRLRERGWHIQFLVDVSTIADLRAEVEALAIDTVFDHFGHVPAARAESDPGFAALMGLVGDGLSWVKLSGAYRITSERTPPYSDAAPLAEAFIAINPDRVLWATDWPHPAIHLPWPDDLALAEMALSWTADPVLRHKLFVGNAERLYGFDPVAAP